MAYQFGYRPTGLKTTNNGATIPYRLVGETDATLARNYAKAAIPLIFGAFTRKDVSLDYLGAGVWDIDAEYATPDKAEPIANACKWTFDTTGKTKHITQGLVHSGTYTAPLRATIDHMGAIGVTDDSVEGVDVPDKAFKWTETWNLPAAAYGFAYSSVLGELTGCMNASYFRGFPANTVAFQGSNGGALSDDGLLREFSFSFEVSPSETGIVIGAITGIEKIGWDYLWVRYETSDDSTAKKTTPKPIQVEVDCVLKEFNFSLLGIGSGILP